MRFLALLLPAVVLLLPVASFSKEHRSQAARHAFVKAHSCPSTGSHKLPCPGYIIDHVMPLCAGGEDAPRNMQWQTVEEAKVKDRGERKLCSKKGVTNE